MTTNPLRDQIAALPRYKKVRSEPGYSDMMMVRPEGEWIKRDVVLAILDAHAPQAEPVALSATEALDFTRPLPKHPYDEQYDNQRDVEKDPCGAWMAIQHMSQHVSPQPTNNTALVEAEARRIAKLVVPYSDFSTEFQRQGRSVAKAAVRAALSRAPQPAHDAVAEAWQPREIAPTDGSHFIAWIDGLPTAVHYAQYDEDVAEECGEAGYWAYSENLLADVAETADFDWWMPMTPPPALASHDKEAGE